MLARFYRIEKPDAATRDAYCAQMMEFSIEIIEEAVERSPTVYPSYFPKVGELLALCHNVVEEIREKKRQAADNDSEEARKKWAKVEKCKHVWRDEAEPEGSRIESFLVCVHCSAVRPVFSQSFLRNCQTSKSGIGSILVSQVINSSASSDAELLT